MKLINGSKDRFDLNDLETVGKIIYEIYLKKDENESMQDYLEDIIDDLPSGQRDILLWIYFNDHYNEINN